MENANKFPDQEGTYSLRESWKVVVDVFETDSRKLRRKIGAGLALSLAGILASTALPVLASSIMGPVEYGAFAFLQGALALISVLSLLGLNNYMVKVIPLLLEGGNIRAIWKLVVIGCTIAIPISVILALLLFYSSHLVQGHASLQQILFLTPIVVLVYFLSFCLQGIRSSLLGAVSRGPLITVLFTILGIFVCGWLLKESVTTRNILWPMVGLYGSLAGALLAAFVYRAKKSGTHQKPIDVQLDRTSHILKTSLPLLAFASSFFLMSQTDILMLGYLTDGSEISAYVFSSRLALLSSVGLLTANIFLPPMISALSNNKRTFALQKLFVVMGFFSNTVFLIVVVMIYLVVESFAGFAGFAGFGWKGPLVVLLIGQFANVFSGSCGYLLTMTGHHNLAAKTTMLAATSNLLLNLALVPVFGTLGAAVATAISIAGANVIMARKALKLTGINSFFIRVGSVGK